jgi:hypothetical protein
MSLIQSSRFRHRMKWIRSLMVLAAASALVSARSGVPEFRGVPSVHVVKATASHDQRPRFDTSASNGFSVATAFVLSPPTEIHARLTLATALLDSFHSKGAHYNRPPPIL